MLQQSREGMRQHALERGVVLIETPSRLAAAAPGDDDKRGHHGTPPRARKAKKKANEVEREGVRERCAARFRAFGRQWRLS